MTRENASKLWPIIKAYGEGKDIEYLGGVGSLVLWDKLPTEPMFDGNYQFYRIKPPEVITKEQKAAIKMLFPDAKWFAFYADGRSFVWTEKPDMHHEYGRWLRYSGTVYTLQIKMPEGLDWKDSLVEL